MGKGLTDEQIQLTDEFAELADKKGINYELQFMVGAIAFGSEEYASEKETAIMKDIIEALKKVKGNQEFFDYLMNTYPEN